MTLAGLNTINLSEIDTFQQFVLFMLIIFGSAILVSIVVVHTRRMAFERRFKSIAIQRRGRRRLSFSRSPMPQGQEMHGIVDAGITTKPEGQPAGKQSETNGSQDHPNETEIHSASENWAKSGFQAPDTEATAAGRPMSIDGGVLRRVKFASATSPTRQREHGRLFSMQGVGARPDLQNYPTRNTRAICSNDVSNFDEQGPIEEESKSHSGFMSGVFIDRNSQFSNLTLSERERLGGVEYRAVSILAIVVPLYFVLWQLLGCIGLGAYVAYNRPGSALDNGENPW